MRIELPIAVFEDIRTKVGRRNMSHYLAETIEETERRAALREWLDEMDAIHGPITDEEAEQARRLLNGAFE